MKLMKQKKKYHNYKKIPFLLITNNSDEEIEELIEKNIRIVALKLVKFLLEILCEIKYSKLNNENINENINEKIEDELLKIKEKEYITQEELEEIF